ncbi:MAG: integrase [Sphingomonadales bacterium]|nr:integrase [Sphingomonadales bacterium]
MRNECFISIYLDTRRLLNDGKYPVRLRVFTSSPRVQKLYPTPFAYSQRDFDSIWNTTKPRLEHKDARLMLAALEAKAMELAKKITPFTHEQFERQYNRKASDVIRIANHYRQRIADLTKSGQLGTASSYELSMKSIARFTNLKKAGRFDRLTFQDVTADWLKEYERYMTETSGKSLTTVGIYLRALRALFNDAIATKDIDPEHYPFGKRRYQIPATKKTKKALSRADLKRLHDAVPANHKQAKARDFWFYSFACSGMNIKDIALLKWKDIEGDKLTFYRAKTMLTTKGRLTPIVVYLNDFAKQVIERYGMHSGLSGDFVFSIINEKDSPVEQRRKIQSFTHFVNQHIKRLAKANGLPAEVSSYWARHSFATTSIRKGASMELVSESLGHGNIRTTQGYFAGFDSDTKRELADSLMDF